MGLSNPSHPVWDLLKTVVYLLFAGFVMYLNASHFDETELKALAWIGTFMFAGEGIMGKLRGVLKGD